jgi:hypothetical protein
MELISQIINELIDNDKPLNGALLKTKVLASRIQNKELLDWVNKELSGYKSNDSLPEYRKNISTFLKGSFINANMKYTNQPIPTAGMDKEFRKSLNSVEFPDSISGLESLVSHNDSTKLGIPLSAEIIGLISENWREMGNPYLQILNANKVISKGSVIEIISKVQNILLDFMLKVDEQFGSLAEIENLKIKKKEISTIVSQTIINNIGDGNILNTGDKAKVEADINIVTDNKDVLQKKLLEIGVKEEDLAELMEIIDFEKPNIESKKFGEKVNQWTSKMLNKALDRSWNIGIGKAGILLEEAISGYYGIKTVPNNVYKK